LSTPKNKDEIGRLVMTFNNLLDRIHHAFELQKNFISNVSHELKNPISAIVSQIQVVLENKNRSTEEYQQTLQSVLNDTHELAETTDNLLQLARLRTEEHQIPKFESVRLDDIILLSREKLLRNHTEYRIMFDIEGLPDSENDLCVMGNDMLLRSAFVNLMDNCCKYSPDKSAYVKVIIIENKQKYVEIGDHGEGIAADDIPLLFQPFYRNPKHKHIKGTGIGLSLVDSICKLHNITLQVISKKGEGTTFRLTMNNQ
jgi:signal transduction histidine kinase